MGNSYAPLVADLVCFVTRDTSSVCKEHQTDAIDNFDSTSRYLYNLFIIGDNLFATMIHQFYPCEIQLNKADSSGTIFGFTCIVKYFLCYRFA